MAIEAKIPQPLYKREMRHTVKGFPLVKKKTDPTSEPSSSDFNILLNDKIKAVTVDFLEENPHWSSESNTFY